MPGRLPTDREDYDPLATITPQQAQQTLLAAAPTATKTELAGAAAAVPRVRQQAQQVSQQSLSPATVFVRRGDEYGSLAQIAPPGSQLLFEADDPNLAAEIADARSKGYSVGIWVVPGNSEDPVLFAQRCAALSSTFHPDILIPDVEFVGKGYEGSAGWDWSQKMMDTYSAMVPDQKTAVTVMPNQNDFNYSAYTDYGAGVWVQTYFGPSASNPQDMRPYDPQAAVDTLKQNGVPESMITTVLAPGQSGAQGIPSSVYGPPPGYIESTGSYAPNPTGGTTPGPFSWSPPSTQPYVAGGYINPFTNQPGTPSTYPPGTVVTPDPNVASGPQAPPPSGTVQNPVNPNLGGGSTNKPKTWADYYFGTWGLDAADMQKLVQIMSKYDDPQMAAQAGLVYLRGTQWYAQHFPGIAYGIQHGLYSDEAGYRDYVNRVNVYSNQYNGRPISSDEIVGYLQAGLDPSYVGKIFEGNAWATANSGAVNYELGAFSSEGAPTEAESKALGQQQVGLSSTLGMKLQTRLQQAAQRMQRIFEGQVAAPSMAIGAQGLNAPSLTRPPDLPA